MNTETNNTLLDLETMMGESLDAIPEAAGFENPPPGEYAITIMDAAVDKYIDKKGLSQQRIKIIYSVATTYSTASGEQPIPDGTLFSETFQGTTQGLGFFKKRAKELLYVSTTDGVTLADMMNSLKGVTVNVRLNIKKTPKTGIPGEFWDNLVIKVVKK